MSPDNPGPYYYGNVVLLTATANPGWTFSAWSGDLVSTDNPASITITGNMNVTATFTQNEYALTTNVVGQGTVDRSSAGPYHFEDVVELTAVPATGWHFVEWTGDLTGSTNPANITIVGVKNVTANFAINEYTLTVTAGTGGTVTKNPDLATYPHGTSVTLTVIPKRALVLNAVDPRIGGVLIRGERGTA